MKNKVEKQLRPNLAFVVDGIYYKGSPKKRETLSQKIRSGKATDKLTYQQKINNILEVGNKSQTPIQSGENK